MQRSYIIHGSMQVVVDGLVTNYSLTGEGSALLILHGWGDTSKSWQALAAVLSKTHRVICVDLPGFGGTQRPTDTWGLDNYAQFVNHFLVKIGISDYVMIAHSNGGAVAVHGIATSQLTPTRLVLVASAGVRDTEQAKKKLLKYAAKGGKLLLKPLPTAMQRRARRKLYGAIGSDYLVVEGMEETFKRVVAHDVQAEAAKVTIPTLLIYGDKDQSTPVRYGQLFQQQIKDATLRIVPGAGHFIHTEETQQLAGIIDGFLQ